MSENVAGLEAGHETDSAALLGQVIDRREHFFYADQSHAAARELMDDLGLESLPLVDRELRVVEVLNRG